ncbi:hypothetical protein C0J52_27016, partial [Blattella germanica]
VINHTHGSPLEPPSLCLAHKGTEAHHDVELQLKLSAVEIIEFRADSLQVLVLDLGFPRTSSWSVEERRKFPREENRHARGWIACLAATPQEPASVPVTDIRFYLCYTPSSGLTAYHQKNKWPRSSQGFHDLEPFKSCPILICAIPTERGRASCSGPTRMRDVQKSGPVGRNGGPMMESQPEIHYKWGTMWRPETSLHTYEGCFVKK